MPLTDELSLLACPICHGRLVADGRSRVVCASPDCGAAFPLSGGVPLLHPGAVCGADFEASPTAPPRRAVRRRRRYANHLYSTDYHMARVVRQFVSGVLSRWAAPGALVADVGCGSQPFRWLVESLGARYVGVDVEQNAEGTVIATGALPHLPLASSSFDLVLCTEVLEHVPDVAAAILDLARVARPGGRVIITAPFVYPLHELPTDFSRPTPYMLYAAAQSAGLQVALLQRAGCEVHALATAWCHMTKGLWSRVHPPLVGSLAHALLAPTDLVANCSAAALGALLAGRLPGWMYLSNQAVFVKPA